jgi:hypothetical protein
VDKPLSAAALGDPEVKNSMYEVYITSFPRVGSKWQVSNGGIQLQDTNGVMDWSTDGKHLRYQQADKLLDVAIRDVGDKLEISPPTEVMTLPADSGEPSSLDFPLCASVPPVVSGVSAPRCYLGNSTSSNCNLSADSYARKAHVCRGRTGGSR